MATGLPVITTRHSGLPEQVTDGANGFLVEEGDYHALAEKILHLAEHPELLPAMSEEGRRHASRYDSTLLIGRQLEAYRELAGRPARRE